MAHEPAQDAPQADVKSVGGRPTSHTPEVATEFLARVADGRSVRSVVLDQDMPSWRTVWRWIDENEEFRARYRRAREIQGHAYAQDAVDEAVSAEDASLGTLAFKARQWFAAKLNNQYGDRQTLEHTGPNGGPITTASIVTDDPAEAARAYQRIISGEEG